MPAGGDTILVVDDDTEMLGLTHTVLTRCGFSVLIASSGQEALNLFGRWPDMEVDLLFVDLIMSGMNGIELVHEIHKLRPGLPFVYCSAYPNLSILRPILERYTVHSQAVHFGSSR